MKKSAPAWMDEHFNHIDRLVNTGRTVVEAWDDEHDDNLGQAVERMRTALINWENWKRSPMKADG